MPAPDMSEPVPVARLIENTSQYIRKHPRDADGYYTLGRIHSIAFAHSFLQPAPYVTVLRGASGHREDQVVGSPQKSIQAIPAGSPYNYLDKKLPVIEGSVFARRTKSESISTTDLFHVRESVRNYAKATELAPKESSYWLGLGWMLEQGAPYAARLGAPWDKISRKRATEPSTWIDKAVAAYRRAYTLESPGTYHNWLAIEAGESVLRLQTLSNRSLTSREKVEVERIRWGIKKIKERPQIVSPIILPLGQYTSMESLVSTQKSVTFDLIGDKLGKRWPWVGSNTGILVWDPENKGRITSGRQLFGSVTWWIFWRNGYEALAALDNNSDGSLTGTELEGISIWRDANGNGISESGEVKPLKEWNITSLSTKAAHQVSGIPANLRGVTLKDGTVLPSYDWTPRSLN